MRILFATRGPAFLSMADDLKKRLGGRVPALELEVLDCGSAPLAPSTPPDILIPTNRVQVPAALLAASGSIGLVQTIGTGYEHIDLEGASANGVWAANVSAAASGNADSVAEHAILLMLALARQLTRAQRNFADGHWAQPRGAALLEKTACIVGLGDIGQALAIRLLAFGMHVIATRRDTARGGIPGVTLLSSHELHHAVSTADHVIVCARADETNRNLIDAAALRSMKPGAMLINIARGTVLDLDACGAAIESGHLGGLGLDVFPVEPFDPNHPLLQNERVFVTPHIAGVTDVHARRSLVLIAENLERFARGEKPRFLLNAPAHPRRLLRS